jgi:uncharacterized surface anchored protein
MKIIAYSLSIVVLLLFVGATKSADNPPQPGIVVKGAAVYLAKGRDNIAVTLTPGDEKAKPLTTTTDEKGEFLFKNVPVGKYKLTAKGTPTGSLRKLKELDPVDVEVASADAPPITVQVKLTIDR